METASGPTYATRSATNYLPMIGAVQVFMGSGYVLLSALAWMQFASHEQPMNPDAQGLATLDWLVHSIEFSPRGLVAFGVILQLAFGWALGLFTVWAGIKSLNGESHSFVRKVSIANLFYLPVGTTVGAMLLVGLRRPSIKQAFRS